MRDRAYRRWQHERKKSRVRQYLVNYRHATDENGFVDMTGPSGPSDDPELIGMSAATPKPCSCAMCGNPRKYFGELTRQEQKAPIVRWDDWDLEEAA